MQKTKYIWLDGKLVAWEKAEVHVLSHALHYGSSVFEGIRFYKTAKGPAIFRLKEHVDRLFYSAEAIFMKVPFSKKEIQEAIKTTVAKNKIESGYIRPVIFYGYGKLGVSPIGAKINVAIAVLPWGVYLSEDPIKVKVSKYIRIHPKSTISDAKIAGHYVNSILANQEALEAGYDEALLLDFKGNIAEGPGENIFIVKKKTIFTPPPGNILKGITRDAVIKIAKDLRIPLKEKKLTLAEVKNADECFFTGTAAEVTPIGIIDKKIIRTGKIGEITSRMKDTFKQIVTGTLPKYSSWLTYVKE